MRDFLANCHRYVIEIGVIISTIFYVLRCVRADWRMVTRQAPQSGTRAVTMVALALALSGFR
jgi:hypothetical protein